MANLFIALFGACVVENVRTTTDFFQSFCSSPPPPTSPPEKYTLLETVVCVYVRDAFWPTIASEELQIVDKANGPSDKTQLKLRHTPAIGRWLISERTQRTSTFACKREETKRNKNYHHRIVLRGTSDSLQFVCGGDCVWHGNFSGNCVNSGLIFDLREIDRVMYVHLIIAFT